MLLVMACAIVGGLLLVDNKQQVKVFSTKLLFDHVPHRKQVQLQKLNMLAVAKREKELAFWLSVVGPKALMDDLLADSGGGASLDCHQEAHIIGRVSYELYGGEVFSEGTSLCHSGFYHGAMEAFLKEKGTVNLAKNMTALCNTFATGFGKFECYHGVGHGVLAYEDYDLPKALLLCKDMPDTSAKSSCFGGAFMENIMVANGQGASLEHTTVWVNNDPLFPCTYFEGDETIEGTCYAMQTSRMLMLYGNNFDRVRQECLKVRDQMRGVCFRSIGRDAAGVVLRDPTQIIHICKRNDVSDALVDQCIIGALNVIVDFWGEKLDGQANEYCRVMPGEHKNICYATLAKRLPEVFPVKSDRDQRCQMFEQFYQYLCKK